MMAKNRSVLFIKYHSGDQINETEMGGACSTYGVQHGAYRVLVERPEGGRQLGRPRRRGEDNIKMDLKEVGWGTWTGSFLFKIGTSGGLL